MGEKNSGEARMRDKSGDEAADKLLPEGESQSRLGEAQDKLLLKSEKHPELADMESVEKKHVREVESLKKSVEEKEGIIKDYENLLKKIQADFDNYRKRIEREREEYSKFVNERLVRKLVLIEDDMERGLADSKGNGGYDAFKSGIEKIRNNMFQLLVEEGLKEIPTKGKFDPYYHEALVVEENPNFEDNEIVEVYQKGFTLGGKVLRPAKVRVSRLPSRKDEGSQERNQV